MTTRPLRVSIENDYEVVVRGVAAMLAPYADRIELVELLADEQPTEPVDVLLFDVFGSGEVHTGAVQRAIFDPLVGHVAVFTSNFDPALIEKARQMGVAGYLSKALSGEQLADSVERIAKGETVVSAPPERSEPNRRRWPGQLHDLTEREAEVLALITQGYDNDAIATRLYISPNTLKSRIRTLYRKLGFENRVQAAVWGVKHGFETDRGMMNTRG
ncbi:MAG: response regulator transcription factor [Actinomycetota bacterium]|nr:response regulator transcription factor [Actinomycetota bacterium]